MPRPGAFAANFSPDTLNRFRDLCKQQGKQYTKVLERLAELYLETDGQVLTAACSLRQSVPPVQGKHSIPPMEHTGNATASLDSLHSEILQRLESVEADDREFVSAFEILLNRVEALEKKVGLTHKDNHHRPKSRSEPTNRKSSKPETAQSSKKSREPK